MSNFLEFRNQINDQLTMMSKHEQLFVTDVTKDELWDTYLKSFPKGTNPIFRERTEHDCQCCKSFIRACGNVVIIHADLSIESIWDVEMDDHYQVVADAMSELVKSKVVTGIYRHFQQGLGVKENHQMDEEGEKVMKWDHFYFKLPKKFVHTGEGNPHMASLESKEMLQRSLEFISMESIDTVLELIAQDSIYRGEEFKGAVTAFRKVAKEFSELPEYLSTDLYLWHELKRLGAVGSIKNTMIGTLLMDISVGMSLDKAVALYESKAAPVNYKRPTALITKGMIEKAQKKIESLGYTDSLNRRPAVMDDITINNVRFANRDAKKAMNVFDEMIADTSVKKLGKIEEVSIDTFLNDILPTASDVELYFENKHQNNLMSLVAPVNLDAKGMFKWGNNFSWAYNGEVADSIKERVKAAGGNVTGDIRCSLSWFNGDDLDAHCIEPRGGVEIYYGNRGVRHKSSGMLDVDMNAGGATNSIDPVENITYLDRRKMMPGTYKLFVRQFSRRSAERVGFDYEIEMDGTIHSFNYPNMVRGDIPVADLVVSKNGDVKIKPHLKSSTRSQEVWKINTNNFHKVKLIMNSPNHWDGEETGNRHLFFILEGCKAESNVRGFFNEFLDEALREHRKVFEVLGSKMIVEPSDDQLCGLGFSSTRRDSVICKVTGAFSRTLKINF